MTTTEIQIRRMFAAFPEKKATKETIAVYTERLRMIDPEVLKQAIDTVLDETEDFFPRIGAIKQAAWKAIEPDGEMAGMKWAIRQLNRIGGYTAGGAFIEPVEYPDAVTQETIRLMTWSVLARQSPDWVEKAWHDRWAQASEIVSKRFLSGEMTVADVTLGAGEQPRPQLKAVS